MTHDQYNKASKLVDSWLAYCRDEKPSLFKKFLAYCKGEKLPKDECNFMYLFAEIHNHDDLISKALSPFAEKKQLKERIDYFYFAKLPEWGGDDFSNLDHSKQVNIIKALTREDCDDKIALLEQLGGQERLIGILQKPIKFVSAEELKKLMDVGFDEDLNNDIADVVGDCITYRKNRDGSTASRALSEALYGIANIQEVADYIENSVGNFEYDNVYRAAVDLVKCEAGYIFSNTEIIAFKWS